MTKELIIDLALSLRNNSTTSNPFKIGEMVGIKFRFVKYNKSAMTASTFRPFIDVPPAIHINANFDERSQKVFCAHEIGHALLHDDCCTHFNGDSLKNHQEYEANLFAVVLLFGLDAFAVDVKSMSNYHLKRILDYNVSY